MMNYKSIALIALVLFTLHAEAEPDYVQDLAQRHAATFSSVRERLLYYAPTNLKETLKNTSLVIGKTGSFGSCGTQSMYSLKKNGHPVIVYCPTGYRLVHDFGEAYAYFMLYKIGSVDDVDNSLDLLKIYHKYLLQAGLAITTRDKNQPYPKICDPLLFVYLFVHGIDPQSCSRQVDKYKAAFAWMYSDENSGAVTESKLKKAYPEQKFDYSKQFRSDFITNVRGQVQAGQWSGQLYHEFFHIINGDLVRPPKSPAENSERELKADEFAIKMLIFDEPQLSMLRIPAFNITQAFIAATNNSDDFEHRLKQSYLETIKTIKLNKELFSLESYNLIMADYEARCKNSECNP